MNRRLLRHEWTVAARSRMVALLVVCGFAAMFAGVAKMYLGNSQMVDVIRSMPKGMLEGFGVHIEMMTSFEGWMAGEPFTFYILLLGAFAAMWGASAIVKERDQGTGEFLFTLPVSRRAAIVSKALAVWLQLTLIASVEFAVVLLFGAMFSTIGSVRALLVISLSGYFASLAFMGIGLALSAFLRAERTAISAGVGVVLVSFLLNMLSGMNDQLSWMSRLSLFRLFDSVAIVREQSLSVTGAAVTVGIAAIGLLVALAAFRRQDL